MDLLEVVLWESVVRVVVVKLVVVGGSWYEVV